MFSSFRYWGHKTNPIETAAAAEQVFDTPITDLKISNFKGYAGFRRRFAALLIDYAILYCFVYFLFFMMGFMNVINNTYYSNQDIEKLGAIVGIITYWLYYALMESSKKQATVGKLAMKIKVVTLNGEKVSFMKASGRYFSKFLSGIFLVGFLMVIITEKKQCLHDILAGCLVVKI